MALKGAVELPHVVWLAIIRQP